LKSAKEHTQVDTTFSPTEAERQPLLLAPATLQHQPIEDGEEDLFDEEWAKDVIGKNWRNETVVNLDNKGLKDQGAVKLSACLPHMPKLTDLYLVSTGIQRAGAEALARALPQTQLIALILGNNLIGDDGARALAAAVPKSRLQDLALQNNNISHNEKELLKRIWNLQAAEDHLRL